MKRLISLLLALTMCFSLTACGSSEDWEGKYNDLLADHEELQTKYDSLEESYKALESDYKSLNRALTADSPIAIYTKDGDAITLGISEVEAVAILGEYDEVDGDGRIWNTSLISAASYLGIEFDNDQACFIAVSESKSFYVYGGVSTGDDISKVLSLWGEPNYQEDDWYLYRFDLNGVYLSGTPDGTDYITVGFAAADSEITLIVMERTFAGEDQTDAGPSDSKPSPIHLNAGDWVVGDDFPSGRYTITTEEDYCLFSSDSNTGSDIYKYLSAGDGGYTSQLHDGDLIHCSNPITLTPYE